MSHSDSDVGEGKDDSFVLYKSYLNIICLFWNKNRIICTYLKIYHYAASLDDDIYFAHLQNISIQTLLSFSFIDRRKCQDRYLIVSLK